MTELIFHPDIQNEIEESYLWYESRAHGLGNEAAMMNPSNNPEDRFGMPESAMEAAMEGHI